MCPFGGLCDVASKAVNTVGGIKDAVVSTVSSMCVRNPIGGNNGNGGCHTTFSTTEGLGYAAGVVATASGIGALADISAFGIGAGTFG
jgi:hypothetical protein